jgi:putative transposase
MRAGSWTFRCNAGRRDEAAAPEPTRELLKKRGSAPTGITTDGLRSSGSASAEPGLAARPEQGLRKNDRAEVSRQPARRREREMQRFQSPGSARRFVSMHSTAYDTFDVPPHLISRRTLKVFRAEAMAHRHAAAA